MLDANDRSAFTIDSGSWGYSRVSPLDHYLNITTVLYELVSTVAYGGNILINVGPTADGRIATIFQERLRQMGAWLGTNGEAVYNTTTWREQNDTVSHGIERGVYYTASKAVDAAGSPIAVYAFVMGWPTDNEITLTQPRTEASTTVRMLGCEQPMTWKPASSAAAGLVITIPPLNVKQLPSLEGPWVFEMRSVG